MQYTIDYFPKNTTKWENELPICGFAEELTLFDETHRKTFIKYLEKTGRYLIINWTDCPSIYER